MMKRRIIGGVLALLLALCFAGCKKKPYVPERIIAEHEFFNEDFHTYIELEGDIIMKDDGPVVRQGITVLMQVLRGTGRKITYYQIDWESVAGDYDIYYHFATETDFRYRGQKFLPLTPVGGGALSVVKARFEYVHTLNEVPEKKEYTYAEEMIAFPENGFASDLSETEDIVTFGAILNDADPEYYRFKYYIDHADSEEASHIDFQVWAETADGLVFPAFGIYHYATTGKDFMSGSDKKISKEIEIVKLHMKLVYHDGGTVRTGQRVITIEELRTA